MNKKIWIGITLTMIIALMQIAISANNPWTDTMKTRATSLLTPVGNVVDPAPDGLPRITLNVPDLEPAEFYNTNPNIAPVTLKVEQKNGWIWNKGFRYDSATKTWTQFILLPSPPSGKAIGNWIKESTSMTLNNIPHNSLNLETNENAIAVFTCRKNGGQWRCGCSSLTETTPCNKWIIQQFTASETAPTQITPPEIPGGPDTTPPVRSNPKVNTLVPPVILTAGTTQATIKLSTDEAAECRYSTTPGTTYGTMIQMQPSPDDPPDGRTHVAGFAVMSGQSYTYYIKCADKTSAVNTNTDDFVISFRVEAAQATPPVDSTPPTITMTTEPTGTLSAGTTSTTVSFTTDESTDCTYNLNQGTTTVPPPFKTTGMTHSAQLQGLKNGETYRYTIECKETDQPTLITQKILQFSVAAAQASPTTAPLQTIASADCTVEIPSTITITDATTECNTRQILGTNQLNALATTQTITGSVDDFGPAGKFLSCRILCSTDGNLVGSCKDLNDNTYKTTTPVSFTKTNC